MRKRLNGWQRLWVLLGIPWMLMWSALIVSLVFESSWDQAWYAGGICVVGWALVYATGIGIAWVIRGFRK